MVKNAIVVLIICLFVNVSCRFMTVLLMEQLNMKGHGEKHAFASTTLYRVIDSK